MASSNDDTNVRNVIERLEGTLELACQQLLNDTPNRENVNFDLNNFWTHFIGATKLISHEATKLCMAFEGEGLTSSEACQCLMTKVETACLALLAVFVTLPKAKGRTLYKEIHVYVVSILQGMKTLCDAIRNKRSSQLQNVGDIWEQCRRVENLPKDNRDAVITVCSGQYDMVEDASLELMEAIQNGGQDENQDFELTVVPPLNGLLVPPAQVWTESDRNVLLPCSGLIKAAKACIKKTKQALSERGDASDERTINELDEIVEVIKLSSSLVDDFVLSLYPPMNHSTTREQASLVRKNSKDLLSSVRNSHLASAATELWIEFLQKAVDHNWVRINDMVLAD